MNDNVTHCGFVALIGRPNVGKSTLLNRIVGQKVSITSRKPQTTRHRLLGIHTEGTTQTIYVDTPGIHLKNQGKALNKVMNKTAQQTIGGVDLVLLLIDATAWTAEDTYVIKQLQNCPVPILVAVNKVDEVSQKDKLLPLLQRIEASLKVEAIVPISAKTGEQVDVLQAAIKQRLPESTHFYASNDVTDKSTRFLLAEIIREKLFRSTGDELPYSTSVLIESMREENNIYYIAALVLVEREGQKRIIIGKQGQKLKAIATAARIDMEDMLEQKVFLDVWIKVRGGWSDDLRAIRDLGYNDDL